ncbi:chemotaxis response regulator protein-glutamate methylesterase [Candidatus Woesearchaeota archaeon]|nr:chemotaxis response regulator protein-glutamate methylesterase [Candidatus Woesearchaeota archaeon]
MPKIKTLIVDDSALMRNLLAQILAEAPDIEVIGTASDPYEAREKIKQHNPDVLTLDIEMPRMDGITFLNNLMRLRPMPVIMLSSLTQEGADITLQALAAGAIDFISKPDMNTGYALEDYARELISKIRIAASSRVSKTVRTGPEAIPGNGTAEPLVKPSPASRAGKAVNALIAIGASTGGTEAIKRVVCQLPTDTPPVIISQHLPVAFSASFARNVDKVSLMRAQLAENGMVLEQGNIYIAPGGRHLLVRRKGRLRHLLELNDGDPVNRHKPSVDVMFRSAAESFGSRCIGLLLTGMGADGALGLKALHDTGAPTLAQDENTSVVWGMPGEAFRLGAVDHLLPLGKIPARLLALLGQLQP